MADINSLSFGCGNTLQASQLNRIVDAINQLATQVETIGDQVEIYIPLSGSENISGVLAPNINEGHDLGKSNKRWATVWASTGGFKTVDFYDQQSPYSKLGRLEINQDGRLQYDDEPLALLSDINNEVNSDNQSFIHFGQNVRGRLDEDYVRIPASLRLDDVDDNEEEDISNNYYNLYCGGINIKGTEFAQVGNRIIEKDDGKEHHTLCVRDGELLFDGNPIGSNPQLGNVLEGINELDLPESSKYLYYNSDNQSFEWADGTGTSGNNVIGLPTGSTSSTSQISLNTNTLSVKSGEGISLTSNTTSFRNIADQNEEVGIIDSTSDPNGRKLFINSGNKGVYIDRLYLYDNQGHTTQITGNGTGITSLSGLSDVSSYTSDQGKYLKVNSNGDGTEWSNISLSDLSNTEIGGLNNALSNGQVLVYDSSLSNWKNTSLPANLPSVSGHANEYLKVKSDGTQAEWTSVAPGSGLQWSDLTSSSANIIDPSHLPVPNNKLGGIRATIRTDSISIESPTATNNSKYYRVQVQSDGVAFVDVPWVGGGSVTSITAGDGLEVGNGNTNPITTSGTIKLETLHSNNTSGTSVGPNSDVSTAGSTFKVPQITYDKHGRITNATEYTMTLPSGGVGNGDITSITVDGYVLGIREKPDPATSTTPAYASHVTVQSGDVQLKVFPNEVLTATSLTNLCNAFKKCGVLIGKKYDTTSENYNFWVAMPYTKNVLDGTYYIASAGNTGSNTNASIVKLVISNNRTSFVLSVLTNNNPYYWIFSSDGIKVNTSISPADNYSRIIYNGVADKLNEIEGSTVIQTIQSGTPTTEIINDAPDVTLTIM